MQRRHQTYDSIRRLLADGNWHDARELSTVSSFVDEWISELRMESAIDVREEDGRTLLRARPEASVAAGV